MNEDLVGRIEKLEALAHQHEVTRKWVRRRVRAVLLALIANLVTGSVYVVHYAKASGAAEEREVTQQRDIARLQQDVAALQRVCGLDPQSISIVQAEGRP